MGPRSTALLLKLLNFSCSRCSFPSDRSDHLLVNINNCLDNAKAENFFSMVKTEPYCDWEGDDPDIFERDLEKYIDWCNNVRIKRRLDGSSPVEYRLGRAA